MFSSLLLSSKGFHLFLAVFRYKMDIDRHKVTARRINQDTSEEVKNCCIGVCLAYFRYASLKTELFFPKGLKGIPVLVWCGCTAFSTSDWLSYFSFLVTNGDHVLFVQQNKASPLVRTIALDLLRGKQCRHWERRKKGKKQGTETRLTLSRTNTIATNLDLQNIS